MLFPDIEVKHSDIKKAYKEWQQGKRSFIEKKLNDWKVIYPRHNGLRFGQYFMNNYLPAIAFPHLFYEECPFEAQNTLLREFKIEY